MSATCVSNYMTLFNMLLSAVITRSLVLSLSKLKSIEGMKIIQGNPSMDCVGSIYLHLRYIDGTISQMIGSKRCIGILSSKTEICFYTLRND